jgi:hypothetical protein
MGKIDLGAVTKGEKAVRYALLVPYVCGIVILSPAILVIGGIIYGVEKAIDLVDGAIDKNTHKKRMKHDWYYRLSHMAPKISNLKMWQERIQELNQYERAYLQIYEAQDIPWEIWGELGAAGKSYFADMMRIYGTEEYIKNKNEVVKEASRFYVLKYAEYVGIDEEAAQQHLLNITGV